MEICKPRTFVLLHNFFDRFYHTESKMYMEIFNNIGECRNTPHKIKIGLDL